MKHWGKRFFSSTRGRVITFLRGGEASVSDMAEELDVTGNAIRSHLATLERDRLVHPSGKRAGLRKPETLYALTPEAEQLFPKAYHLLFIRLLSQLEHRLSAEEMDALLIETGRSLAGDPVEGSLRERVDGAVAALEKIGGQAELQESASGFTIRGASCPLSDAVLEHPKVCRLAEALLSATTGANVTEHCDRNGKAQCVFHVEIDKEVPSPSGRATVLNFKRKKDEDSGST